MHWPENVQRRGETAAQMKELSIPAFDYAIGQTIDCFFGTLVFSRYPLLKAFGGRFILHL